MRCELATASAPTESSSTPARRRASRSALDKRAAKVIAAALKDSDNCPLLLEQTAGHKGLLGRDFDQTAELIELAGGGERLGLCLDSCHLFVQGYDVTDEEHLAAVLDEADAKVGLDRLRCLHVNDAAVPLGSCRDRHANIGKGEMGSRAWPPSSPSRDSRGCRRRWRRRGPVKKGPGPQGSPGRQAPAQDRINGANRNRPQGESFGTHSLRGRADDQPLPRDHDRYVL